MKFVHPLIICIAAFFFSPAIAQSNPLNKAISHAEKAIEAPDGKDIAAHAQQAKTSALEVKKVGNFSDETKYHLEAGIINLEHAIEKANAGSAEAAHQQVADAVKHFKEISR